MKRIAVLISGGGSNLQALIDAIASSMLPAEIVLVLANRANAFGLERARKAGIATRVLPLRGWLEASRPRDDYDADVAVHVSNSRPELVILAGWMHVFGPAFLDRVGATVINLHPALPGQFPGTRAIERAFEAYGRGEIAATGVMIHKVIPEVDAGPVLGETVVPIEPGDTLADLSARMHAAEHELLVKVVRALVTAGRPS